MNLDFCLNAMSIVLINVILSGDNAVVIAMAVRSLPPARRRLGIYLGTVGAVVLRVGLTFVAAKLLDISFLKIAGGIMIAWLAIKLFVEDGPEDGPAKEVTTVRKAIVTILIADLVMSMDNVLAVAGACKGNLFLLILGLGTSIPLVVFASNLLARLIGRYHFLVYLGAAVLGKVSGEMIISDPFTVKVLHNPGQYMEYGVQAAFAFGVVAAGKVWMRRRSVERPAVVERYMNSPFYVAGWDLT